jgi:hypothetical protein
MMAYGHPLHLTFTNLEYKTQNNRWVLTVKVFTDDFASGVRMDTGMEMAAGKKSKTAATDEILKKWLNGRFKIWFDSKPVETENWKFEGIEIKEDASWITYTIMAPMPTREIKIRNTLLLDQYPDQKNLFVLVMGQIQSAHEFKNKDQETIIKLNK